MLQQTQASRVVVPYGKMIERFESPAAMASASQAEVVRLWQGLGYNSRAIRLHRCAAAILEHYDGQIPRGERALQSLPGVGAYTARAIMVFAFEEDVAVLDTNVSRVLSRCVAGTPLTRGEAQSLADAMVLPGQAWRLNQAILDHGATRCRSVPVCVGCPLRRSCAWARKDFLEPDPAARSALAPAKQARFVGSQRQLRGQLIELARKDRITSQLLRAIEDGFGSERTASALAALVDEGFLVKGRNSWTLA
jgi:A/G-specific adenine glycosylase